MYDKTHLNTLTYHHSMLIDDVRMESYLRAILHSVKPGDVVVDLGSGTGILALFACLAGARHVYAVEQGAVMDVARRVVDQNGYNERVTFIKDWSTNVQLPEKANVLVTETIGNLGFEEGILGWVIDGRKRLLAPGGRVIPQAVELLAVPVESQENYDDVEVWLDDFYSFDFSSAQAVAANNLHWDDMSPDSFLSEPAQLTRVDFEEVMSEDINGTASFVITRDGQLHGIAGWFAAELIPGIRLSNMLPNQTPSWTQGFLPLESALPVKAGDQLWVEVQTQSNAADWRWCVTKNGKKVGQGNGAQPDFRFEQNTHAGQLTPRAEAPDLKYTPSRSPKAEVDLFILGLMDGTRPIEQIAHLTAARFPAHFNSFEKITGRVENLCEYYDHWRSSDVLSTKTQINLMEVNKLCQE